MIGVGGLRPANTISFIGVASYNTQRNLPHTQHKGVRLIQAKKDIALLQLSLLCSYYSASKSSFIY